jgi:hypothetical protein
MDLRADPDPDPHKNVMNPPHWKKELKMALSPLIRAKIEKILNSFF